MTGQQPEIQWYIAREGKQHGPLSDPEMRTFVAQGHLRPTDLIWRAGFTDWRPAPTVFPLNQPEPAAAPPARPPERSGLTAEPAAAQPAQSSSSDLDRSFEPDRIRMAEGSGGGGASNLSRIIGVGVVIALIAAAGGWYVMQGDGGTNVAGTADGTPVVRAPAASSGAPTPTPPSKTGETQTGALATPPPAKGVTIAAGGVDEVDAKFQETALWTVVKREFPEWYGERLNEVVKLKADNQTDLAIHKHLAESLVALRRKHASDALAASTDTLKSVANAFLNNLKSLSTQGANACYSFISKGETAPAVLELLAKPEQSAVINAQVAAIFEAIAEGRKTPVTHPKAVKADYEELVRQLAKLGWKETDLKTFSDPNALGRQPAGRVCQMVQDWFVAHLAVKDQQTQERLLVETLKPVVSG